MYSEDKPPPYSPNPPTMNQPAEYHGDSVHPPTVTQPTGFQTVPQAALPNYGSTVYIQQIPPPTQVVFVGGCPACRVGVLEDDFTCLGVCLAIFCFPIGILCCLALKQRRCPNCGAIYG